MMDCAVTGSVKPENTGDFQCLISVFVQRIPSKKTTDPMAV
jgi:hypothetical protein